jgi:prevent-host-death family protein
MRRNLRHDGTRRISTRQGDPLLPNNSTNGCVVGRDDQNSVHANPGGQMRTLTAKEAKHDFGRLIDLARAETVAVAKHGRPIVVVMAAEEFERLNEVNGSSTVPAAKRKTKK